MLLNPLRRIPGVGSVMLRNAPDQILRINIHQDRLLAHGLTMSEVTGLIQANNMNIPAGDLTIDQLRFSMRLLGEQKDIAALKSLALIKSPISGSLVTLGDIADIQIDLETQTEIALVNGKTSILGYLRKTPSANSISIAEKAELVFVEAENVLPTGTKIQIIESGATIIKGTIRNLSQTVAIGGLLVSLIVFLFLRRIAPTVIIALSIPLSMIVTFLVVYAMGFTLNSVTLIAMSLVVGMVVDNVVVHWRISLEN